MHGMKHLLAVAAAALALAISSDVRSEAPRPGGRLDAAVHALASASTWKGADVSVAILDVATGQMLASYNEHHALNPASNAKLYTAAAALAILHANHRYETSLSGVLKGTSASSVTLRGYGDPSLGTEDLAAMVEELRLRGVRRIDGDILVDQRFYDDQTTPPAFDQKPKEWAAFRAPVSALAVDENTVTLDIRPSEAGQTAHAFFQPPGFVDVDGTVTTASGSGADTVGLVLAKNGSRLSAKLSGKVGEDAKLVRFTRRVDDPTLLAGYVLRAELERAQIKVTGEVKAGNGKGPILARHLSAPLSNLLYALGKNSDNFYAEMIFKSLAAEKKGRPGHDADAAQLVTKVIGQMGATDAGIVIKNGSGLYDANRVTTSSVVHLLRAAWRDAAIQPEYVAQLSIGGVDGTLRRRFRSERERRDVRAKTGTLDDVIALSGYVLGPPGKEPIAFSILFNKVAGKASRARIDADRVVRAIVREQWGGSSE
jgi:D-alanyl-D-alanine carboxypeptidase/D-alanyl-D-alanine-endopeptidase (penicillin-binding protein 4)